MGVGSTRVVAGVLAFFLAYLGLYLQAAEAGGRSSAVYVGAKACSECHETEYKTFMKYSKKARSFSSIQKMRRNLTDEEVKGCFACHTTGYAQPGGFVNEKETPELKNLSCEVCHGPGSKHVETEDAEDINRQVPVKRCSSCHNKERVAAFRYKPMRYAGAH